MVAKKKVVKKVAAKKKAKKPIAKKMDLLDVLRMKIELVEKQCIERSTELRVQVHDLTNFVDNTSQSVAGLVSNIKGELDDKLLEVSNNYLACQTAVLEALAKRPDIDGDFLHNRIVVLEMQVKELNAKLLELSPELS